MPAYFLRNHAVNGHAAMPDSSANQPLVSGSGPFSNRSMNPPPPATTAQSHAAIQATVWLHFLGRDGSASRFVFVSSLINPSLTEGLLHRVASSFRKSASLLAATWPGLGSLSSPVRRNSLRRLEKPPPLPVSPRPQTARLAASIPAWLQSWQGAR